MSRTWLTLLLGGRGGYTLTAHTLTHTLKLLDLGGKWGKTQKGLWSWNLMQIDSHQRASVVWRNVVFLFVFRHLRCSSSSLLLDKQVPLSVERQRK